MTEVIALELPETLVRKVKEIASFSDHKVEDMLIEWIARSANEMPVDSLPDRQILDLCDFQMDVEQQEILSDLLALNREDIIGDQDAKKMDELMQIYRQGTLRKAQALNIAVKRGLIPDLSQS